MKGRTKKYYFTGAAFWDCGYSRSHFRQFNYGRFFGSWVIPHRNRDWELGMPLALNST
jgi:hypothetical protein